MTPEEQARTFLAGVLAKLPENLRAQAEAAFNDAAASQALSELGAGVLRQQDYSRNMDEARAAQTRATELYNQNKVWYDANAAEVAAAAELRARVAELEANPNPPADPKPPVRPNGQPPADTAKYATIEDLQATARDALGLFATVPTLALRHSQTFGEILPLDELITEAQTKRISLDQAYKDRYATQLKAKADEAEAARVQKIKDEAIADYRRANPQLSYPIPGRSSGSPLDSLQAGAPKEPDRNLVDEATQMYHELVASKV